LLNFPEINSLQKDAISGVVGRQGAISQDERAGVRASKRAWNTARTAGRQDGGQDGRRKSRLARAAW